MKARYFGSKEDKTIAFYCPGCKENHVLNIDPNKTRVTTIKKKIRLNGKIVLRPIQKVKSAPCWKFNNNFNSPTFTPSVLVRSGKYAMDDVPGWYEKQTAEFKEHLDKFSIRCHSYVTDGKIKFLNDSTHELKGQTVELEQLKLPEYYNMDWHK